MNAQTSAIWTDATDNTPIPSPTPSLFSSAFSSFPTPQFSPNTQLTEHQKTLLSTYLLHSHFETEAMNSIVDLDISVRRERDEPGVRYLRDELEDAQRDLVVHREGKRRARRWIREEEERLKRVVREAKGEEEKSVARRQLDEMETVMDRGQKVECLR